MLLLESLVANLLADLQMHLMQQGMKEL